MMQSTQPSATASRRRLLKYAGSLFGSACLTSNRTLCADDESVDSSAQPRLRFEEPKTQQWRIGLDLQTPVACTNVLATFPIPKDWPEQTVTVIDKNIDTAVTDWETRDIAGGVRQVALRIARLPARSQVQVTFDFEVQRWRIETAGPTDDLVAPNRRARDLRIYFGNSPFIDASNARIKRVSRELAKRDYESPWQQVEAIYDYVRDNVKYTQGELKEASQALRDQRGDCEEMTSLFVALCRNAGIPARMVWIPDHAYPEFYLQDQDRNGTWFPCQAAGTRQFGRMDEYRPVLQKGDRFKVDEKKSPVRYVSEFFRCDKRGKKNPRPKFIREPLDV